MAFDAVTALLGLAGGAAGTKLIEVVASRRSARIDDASKLTGSALELVGSMRADLAATKVELAATQAEVTILRDALSETRQEVGLLRERQAHYDTLVSSVETLRQEMLSGARRIHVLERENAELSRMVYHT